MQVSRTKLLKAIRLKCLDCSAGQAKEVELCPCKECSLYEYRGCKHSLQCPVLPILK